MRRFIGGVGAALACLAALSAQTLQFEVASVRRNGSGDLSSTFRVDPGGQLTVTNRTLFDIVRSAYDVQRDQILRAPAVPGWFDNERWDIVAKAPENATAPAQVLEMARQLLADRFKLVAHRETREAPAFALVLAHVDRRLGPRLRAAAEPCSESNGCGTKSGPSHLSARGIPMVRLARHLSVYTGRVVVDATELPGLFDVDLEWTADQPGAFANAPVGDRGSIFTVLREQLGLALEPSRTTVEVVVVEQAERPSEN